MSVYNIRFYQSRTIQGTLAGMLTKSGTIGTIASVPIPEVIMGIDAFHAGAAQSEAGRQGEGDLGDGLVQPG